MLVQLHSLLQVQLTLLKFKCRQKEEGPWKACQEGLALHCSSLLYDTISGVFQDLNFRKFKAKF